MKKIFAKMATITAISATFTVAAPNSPHFSTIRSVTTAGIAAAANNPAQAVKFKFNWQGDVAMHHSFFFR
ncbi:MAG: hypothetical protein V7K40_03830 [Nostoc sp.]|uniref:hypothetical protein n=1 Tax=Nostoc sp. TaxID=1180 RepID=UPI002FFBEF11